jgi:nucleoside-diphosphate-sugar epimerase
VAAREGEQAVLHGETPACVLRAGFNYGPGSDSLLALHRALINRGMLDLGSSEHAVWVHEADLARAAVLAVEKQPAGEILNVTDGNDLSPLAFAQAFASSLGVPPPRPVNLPGFVRRFTGGSSALLTTSVQATSAKAAETLDWSPQYADIASGLEQTLLARRAAQVM